MARLVAYNSSAELLGAVIPHLLPHREWQSHFVVGLNLENIDNPPNPLDFFATTWVGDELQVIAFHFHKLPINLTPCRELYDMRFYDQQLQLLAEFISSRSEETIGAYSIVTGPEGLSTPLAQLIGRALDRSVEFVMTCQGSYIDKAKFIPISLPDPTHVVRQAKLDDNIERMARLVRVFQQYTANLHTPMSLEALIEVLPRPIGRGFYYIYILPDGTIPALAMVRRITERGMCITMVVTDEEHRGKGYGSALTSWVVQNALDPIEKGGRGKRHVCIFWDADGSAGRIYKRLGFVEGQIRKDWKLLPSTTGASATDL